MKTWQQYKQTFRTEPDMFDFARQGDLRGFANLLTQNPTLDLNAKNHRGYSAMMLAVYNGQAVFCEALLRGGADVNSSDLLGNTLLMGAAFKGDLSMVKLLLDFNADTRLTNKSNMNAHDWAVMFKREAIINYLEQGQPNLQRPSTIKNLFCFIKLSMMMCVIKLKGLKATH